MDHAIYKVYNLGCSYRIGRCCRVGLLACIARFLDQYFSVNFMYISCSLKWRGKEFWIAEVVPRLFFWGCEVKVHCWSDLYLNCRLMCWPWVTEASDRNFFFKYLWSVEKLIRILVVYGHSFSGCYMCMLEKSCKRGPKKKTCKKHGLQTRNCRVYFKVI